MCWCSGDCSDEEAVNEFSAATIYMKIEDFGTEAFTQEDRAYQGSRFMEVRDAIFANPYQKLWGGEGVPPLPIYKVTLSNQLRGIL